MEIQSVRISQIISRIALRNITVLVLVFLVCASLLVSVDGICGYSSCPKTKPGYLNVHLVAHSHDDVGWLKTIDQYYYGSNNSIQRAAVQYTLDSVVEELQKSPDRRFIYVESAFFWRWWRNQDEKTRETVRTLVNNGQLEFISGGWSMSDEGCTHYSAIVDQMSLGLRYLNATFGQCAQPKVGWQIDPFGHSREQASLFSQMGFDGLFIGRLDYQERSYRRITHNLEMIWNSSPKNLGKAAWLFTGILYNYYLPPQGFCFDILCDDEQINDDPRMEGYNVERKIREFIEISKRWAAPYDTDHVLLTMGSDFQYMAAHTWYKNLDKLIKHINLLQSTENSKINLIYSTPSCYLQEVHKSGKPLPMKSDDFFPYSNDPYGFWSGYFTSRPNFKYFINQANNFLQVCKQLAIGAFHGKPSQTVIAKVFELKEPVAVVQHHDGITGTAKQHVTDDYSLRLSVGMKNCDEVVSEAFTRLQSVPKEGRFRTPFASGSYQFCHSLNISACASSETLRDFLLSVYNPLARDLENVYIRIPVVSPIWSVRSKNGLIPVQITKIPPSVQNIPGRKSYAAYELIFRVNTLEGLTLSNFRVTESASALAENIAAEMLSQLAALKEEEKREEINFPKKPEDIVIRNSVGVSIVIDSDTGLLKSVQKGSVELPIKQNYYYYRGMAGNNTEFDLRASGLYVFRPNTTNSINYQPIPVAEKVQSYKVYRGLLVSEVHQVFTPWLSQVIRLYDTQDFVEFEWLIGPIPIGDNYGKEIITRYTTNLPTKGIFFTDSNGRQLIKRKRNHRSYPFFNFEKVAGNYYPVPTRMLISSNEELSQNAPTLVILNDRAQGGTSMSDGEIELMLHRRLLFDDAFGVGEALNETAYGVGLTTRGKHWLLLAGAGTGTPISRHREIAQNIFMEKIMGFASAEMLYGEENLIQNSLSYGDRLDAHLSSRKTIIQELTRILPSNIQLMTVEPLSPSQFLLRLEHFYETHEDAVLSSPVNISLRRIIQALPFIKSMRETSLGGNQWVEDVRRFEWNLKKLSGHQHLDDESITKQEKGDDIVLTPMQIRTFVVET